MNKSKTITQHNGKFREKKKLKTKSKVNKSAVKLKLVEAANKLEDPLKLLKMCSYERNGQVFVCDCRRSANVDSSTWAWIFKLEEKNMKNMYDECNWGWKFEKKKMEMTDKMAWYLILKTDDGEFVGFSHFRFDMDYGSAVLYCYELQLEEKVHRIGLGSFIMNVLENIAFSNNMEKIVLTVFKHNKSAYNFYTFLKYITDVTSPEDTEKETFCYVILSKEYKQLNKDFT